MKSRFWEPRGARTPNTTLAVEMLESAGDTVVAERRYTVEESRAVNRRNTAAIRRRAGDLCRRFPEAAPLIREYVEGQDRQTEALGGPVACAAWLLRRPR